jgi:hypothetical protein
VAFDELPIDKVGTVVAAPPKRELNPHALSGDLTDRGSAQRTGDTVGVEAQAEDGARQAIRSVCAQQQSLLTQVAGPVAPEKTAGSVDLDGQAEGDARAAATLPGDDRAEGLQVPAGLCAQPEVHRHGSIQ